MKSRRLSTTGLACLGIVASLTFFAPVAQADWPEVVSAAPKDSKIFVGTTSLGELDKQWKQLMTAIEMDGAMPFVPTDAFGQMGVSSASLDLTRSIGISLTSFDDGPEGPAMIMLLPVTDYAKWASSFGPDVKADGVAEVIMASGDTGYIRSAGRYAVLSPRKELAESYAPQENAVNHFKSRVGAVGAGVIERSQMFAIVDFDGLAEHKQEILSGVSEAISQQMAQMGAMGMGMPATDQIAKMNEALVEMLIDECSAVVAGVRYGERGFAIDLAVQTREGSEIGGLMPGSEKPRNLLSNFEDAPFLFAMTMDYGGIKVGQLMDTIGKRLGLDPAAGGGQGNPMANMNVWRHTDGIATAIYPSPGGLFAGLLSRSITLMSGDSEKIMATLRQTMNEMNGTEQGGMKVTTEYAAGAKEIGGVAADTYAVRMTAPPEMMQMQQAMSMIYGPAGLQGYILPVKGGVLQTTSRNGEIVEKSMAAIKGDAPGMAKNKAIAAVDQMLPPDSAMRFYIGIGAIAKMAGPMVAMAVPGLDLEPFGTLPPLALGASINGGGVIGSFVVPAPVIKSAAETAMQFGGGMGGGMDEEEPPLF